MADMVVVDYVRIFKSFYFLCVSGAGTVGVFGESASNSR